MYNKQKQLEYNRRWRNKNQDKVKQYKINALERKIHIAYKLGYQQAVEDLKPKS